MCIDLLSVHFFGTYLFLIKRAFYNNNKTERERELLISYHINLSCKVLHSADSISSIHLSHNFVEILLRRQIPGFTGMFYGFHLDVIKGLEDEQ
jgi:hypothetical protein